jgi:hypothetical protein
MPTCAGGGGEDPRIAGDIGSSPRPDCAFPFQPAQRLSRLAASMYAALLHRRKSCDSVAAHISVFPVLRRLLPTRRVQCGRNGSFFSIVMNEGSMNMDLWGGRSKATSGRSRATNGRAAAAGQKGRRMKIASVAGAISILAVSGTWIVTRSHAVALSTVPSTKQHAQGSRRSVIGDWLIGRGV